MLIDYYLFVYALFLFLLTCSLIFYVMTTCDIYTFFIFYF